jgi:phosphocarrier protein
LAWWRERAGLELEIQIHAAVGSAGAPQSRRSRRLSVSGAMDDASGEQPVLTRIITICNSRGLHARAAAKFVTLAERYGASVDVVKDGQSVSARSIMGLMMLGAGRGSQIELRAEGWDAKEALEALAALVEAGFDERD